jgi:hypothetical protein
MLKVDQPITRYISVYFFALTALFLAIGISFILICKKDQPEFYEEYKTYLWGAVVCLITPLLLRCVLDWMQSVDWWQEVIYKDVTTYNLCFFYLHFLGADPGPDGNFDFWVYAHETVKRNQEGSRRN